MPPPIKRPALAGGTSPKPAVFSLPEGKRKSIMRNLGIHAATDPEDVDKPPETSENLLELKVEKPQIIEGTKDTRLVISFIKVENFKSYQGVHEIGPLHKNINVVTGANGTGKSNVMEAVLFCFGAADSTARCNKLCEFIHKVGGREREESCTVEVTFHEIKDEDRHKFTCIPNTTFTIARQVFKSSSSSKFFFNGKQVSMQHNKDLLKRVGIDMDFNRSAILQGNIQEICMMQPDELLRFLENYGETHRFIEPIEKLEKKVNELNVQFSNEKCQYQAIQRHIAAYHDLAMENVEYINTHNELTISQAKLHKYNILDLKPKLSTAKNDYEEKEKEAHEKKNELEEKKKDHPEAIEKSEKSKKAFENAEIAYAAIRKICDKWVEEDRKMKNRLMEKKGNIDKFQDEISKIQDTMGKMNSEVPVLNNSIADDTRQLENLALKISDLENKDTQNFMDYDSKVSDDKEILGGIEIELGQMKEKQAAVEVEYRVIEDKCQRMIVWDVEQERENLAKAKKMLNEAMEDQRNTERNLLSKRNEKAEIGSTSSQAKLNEYENQLGYQKQKLGHIQRDLSIFRRCGNNPEIASNRCREARMFSGQNAKNFKGVNGCLGDLVTTTEKYNRAISTLLGKTLDIVLCETDEDCSRGIKYLKDNKLKRVTFLSQEKARTWAELDGIDVDRRESPKPLLFDQIEFEKKPELRDVLRRIFYRCLDKALIVQNRKELRTIDKAKQRDHNIMTEYGEYVQRNGNITGGATSVNRILVNNGLNDAEKRKEIEKLEMEEEGVKDKVATLKKQCENQQKSLNMLRSLEQEIAMLEQGMSRNSQKIDCSQQEIAIKERMMFTKVPMTQQEFDQEQNVRIMKFQQFQRENEKIEEKEKERHKLQEKVDAVFREIVGKSRKELKKLEEQSRILAQQIAKSRAKLESHPKYLRKLQAKLEEKEKDKKEAVAKHDKELEKNSEEFRKRGDDLDNEAEETKTAYMNALSEHNRAVGQELKASRELYEAEFNSAKSEELFKEAHHQYISIGDQLTEHHEGLQACRSMFLNIKTWDPQLQLELDQGSIVLPDDVMEGLDHTFLDQFEELNGIQAAGSLVEEENSRKNLESKLEFLGKTLDKEGIWKYTMAKNALNDVFSSKEKSAKTLHQHRLKLNQFEKARYQEFTTVLRSLSDNVSRLYRLVVPGGNAMLKLVTDSLSDGVQFRIRPTGKAWSGFFERSGGEKSLASLVLVLALLEFRSTPVFLMDEVDAALDFRVVKAIAKFLATAKDKLNAQFLVVSHRLEMQKAGDRLVGIYKRGQATEAIIIAPEMVGDHVSKLAIAFAECDLSDRNINRLSQNEGEMKQEKEEEL